VPSRSPKCEKIVSPPRLIIAAPQGRSGKTTVSLGLCSAWAARGLTVQPFKKGPDYIDPSWLSEAAGRPCRTLDAFFFSSQIEVERAFLRGARNADVNLIEGNHGLYDSLDDAGTGSTAAVARWLRAPIILVVNTARMARSVAALVRGYQTFEAGTPIAGVILNNVGHARHQAKLRSAIERHCDIPVVGALSRDETLTIPDRHLGLVPRAEDDHLVPAIQACRRAVERDVDLDAILDIARAAPLLAGREDTPQGTHSLLNSDQPVGRPVVRIGVIRDRVFTFYYPENLEALADAGAELVFIDALRDAKLPQVAALYIGGGFPEMFMEELSANRSLRLDLRSAASDGLPIYAECGGLMYLARRLVWGSRAVDMVGALPCDVEMTDRPQGHGYVIAEATGDNPFMPPGSLLRGHEFHHSRIVNWQGDLPTAYRLLRGNGLGHAQDGLVYRNVLAAYTHLHAAGSPAWAQGVLDQALAYMGKAAT
jgi:cobyrinic acid a,c-diamide synthase